MPDYFPISPRLRGDKRDYLEIVEEFGTVILKAALPVLRPEESLFAPSFPERFFTPGEDLGVQQLS